MQAGLLKVGTPVSLAERVFVYSQLDVARIAGIDNLTQKEMWCNVDWGHSMFCSGCAATLLLTNLYIAGVKVRIDHKPACVFGIIDTIHSTRIGWCSSSTFPPGNSWNKKSSLELLLQPVRVFAYLDLDCSDAACSKDDVAQQRADGNGTTFWRNVLFAMFWTKELCLRPNKVLLKNQACRITVGALIGMERLKAQNFVRCDFLQSTVDADSDAMTFALRKRFLTSVTKSKPGHKKKHARQLRTYATIDREASSCDGSLLSLCIDDRKGKSVWFAEHWTIDWGS